LRKCLLASVAVAQLVLLSSVHAQDRWRIEVEPRQGNGFNRERDIEMRNPYSGDRFRGEIDRSGDVRMRNQDGERLRGNIDKDGYGRLRDEDGNTWRVRPR
jgi:hypothetical protein